ncbi:hypothetical protein LO763_20885 [Glycomyces sp. A-F 0318]|uniref:hypothetical protein n=1 Tax=Glycomyces amatae TaxID=2881355 RepID=UPI001E2BD1EC|nr:hypothetical protein [Glycomyces amatae]MCD0446071.1 hypothetical protein [Glycomyces amatae]
MDNRRPLDNPLLNGMFFTGAASLVLGAIIWLTATDFDSSALYGGASESNPVGQFIGALAAGFGLILLALGWTAAVICRQLLDTATTAEDR